MDTYRKIPALAAYIDRIGAEELNFKRFMVKEYKDNHYYKERCIIRIDSDGSIHVNNKDYAPTDDEAKAIREALQQANFPRCIHATEGNINDLLQQLGTSEGIYEFWNRANDSIIMVQQRIIVQGKKAFVPWTFWSDAEWRRMEPEQNLPFWKPRKPTGKLKIMVHEGAKTAAYVQDLINSDKTHPWKDELKEYEHWGMIGGALAPHRTDYSELVKQKPSEVVYVCDNDYIGKSAIAQISKSYGQSLRYIMFDGHWPESWDMADPMPKNMFHEDGKRFKGSSLSLLMNPGTWATDIVTKGKSKPYYVLRSSFTEEWAHCITPDVYVHKDAPNRIYMASEFNDFVKPFSDVDDTARLVKNDAAIKSYVLKYNPSVASGIFMDKDTGERYINTHIASTVKEEEGDPTPWLEFIDHLITSEEDKKEMLRWVSTLIAAPQIKMLYGVLLISEQQGVGKGTLGEKILTPLIGKPNVSTPSESEIVDSNFNYWAAHKRLAVVHEIYAGHSAKAYNKLKSLITDRYITVSKKFQASYEIENWLHVFACSNSLRALQISLDDRRWFVPRVTSKKQSPLYWANFVKWLEEDGGLGIIKHWAHNYIHTNGSVQKGETAPMSVAKSEVIEEGFSPGMALVANFLDRVKIEMENQEIAILDVDLIDLIKTYIYEGRVPDKLEKASTIRRLAQAKGWIVSNHIFSRIKGSKAKIIASHQSAIERKDLKPLDVSALASKWISL